MAKKLRWGMIALFSAALLYACAQSVRQAQVPGGPTDTSAPKPAQATPPPEPQGVVYEDPTTIPEPGPPYAKANRDPEVILKDFPRDAQGNIDWVKALKETVIKPKGVFEEGKPEIPPFPLDIEIGAVGAMPNVIFPHFPHTMWLECGNCHPNIFVMRRGANPISMVKIVNGEFCGRCHGRVAFPIANCLRCHVKPKG